MTRHIDFEGIHNFRDFGGYAAAGGRRMKTGQLFRSANHHQATDADLERLKALGVSVLVDLRQPNERSREPSRRWDGFACQVVENDLSEAHLDFEALVRESDLSADWFRSHSIGFYERAPHEERHIDLFRRYFEALAQTDGAVLVHCAAGKDRTGLICAFTHHIAGVHRDDILHDYLLTNDEARLDAKVAFLGPFFEGMIGRRPQEEALRVAVSVHEDYLEQAFRTIEQREGSLDLYLERVLGVGPEVRERLHDRLLA